MNKTILAFALAGSLAGTASATTLFFDDFEGGLSQWTQGSLSSYYTTSAIVTDPVQGDHALRAGLNSGGDIQNRNAITSASGNYIVSFDYLGNAVPGSNPGDFGGFLFWTGTWTWIGGTSGASGYPNNLIDDGQWHSYSFALTSGPDNYIYIEDWIGSGYIAGDAYFDNVRVTDEFGPTAASVPEPASLGLFGLGLLGLAAFGRRRSRTRA